MAQNRRERGESEGSALSCVCGHTSVGENSHDGNFAGLVDSFDINGGSLRQQQQQHNPNKITKIQMVDQPAWW